MLRSLNAFFLLLTVTLFLSCSTDILDDGDVQFKKAPNPPVSTPCATAFLSTGNPPGSVITIIHLPSGALVSSFVVNSWGTATDYVTLETGEYYRWQSSISLPGQVHYCSCGENYGILSHGPGASMFSTSDDGTPYSTCAF